MRDATRFLGMVLRWMMVVMLMITPLRTVMADGGHCDMANMSGMDNMAVHMSRSDSSSQSDSALAKTMDDMPTHKCCEEGGSNNCQHHCGMDIHVSMFVHSVTFIHTSFTSSLFETTIDYPVFRQRTPLLRPPSSLNS